LVVLEVLKFHFTGWSEPGGKEGDDNQRATSSTVG
jgi:hypothetical protein